jgi:hypothetical protein
VARSMSLAHGLDMGFAGNRIVREFCRITVDDNFRVGNAVNRGERARQRRKGSVPDALPLKVYWDWPYAWIAPTCPQTFSLASSFFSYFLCWTIFPFL